MSANVLSQNWKLLYFHNVLKMLCKHYDLLNILFDFFIRSIKMYNKDVLT